jgi:hypothetical protein
MLLGGLWHGAEWTFIIWGGLHGFYLIFNHGWRKLQNKLNLQFSSVLYRFVSISLTFFCVIIAWVFFRASDIHTAIIYLQSMFGLQTSDPSTHQIYLHSKIFLVILLIIVLLFPNSSQIMNNAQMILDHHNLLSSNVRKWYYWRATGAWGAITGLIFSMLLMGILCFGDGLEFLYFQF